MKPGARHRWPRMRWPVLCLLATLRLSSPASAAQGQGEIRLGVGEEVQSAPLIQWDPLGLPVPLPGSQRLAGAVVHGEVQSFWSGQWTEAVHWAVSGTVQERRAPQHRDLSLRVLDVQPLLSFPTTLGTLGLGTGWQHLSAAGEGLRRQHTVLLNWTMVRDDWMHTVLLDAGRSHFVSGLADLDDQSRSLSFSSQRSLDGRWLQTLQWGLNLLRSRNVGGDPLLSWRSAGLQAMADGQLGASDWSWSAALAWQQQRFEGSLIEGQPHHDRFLALDLQLSWAWRPDTRIRALVSRSRNRSTISLYDLTHRQWSLQLERSWR